VIHKPQVMRSLTQRLSRASHSAYSTYKMQYYVLLYLSMDVLIVHYVYGDRLHGSTLPYTSLDVVVLLLCI
jgi:ABC-type enterochelin transport system permease subunit